jgi:hypothetical protein
LHASARAGALHTASRSGTSAPKYAGEAGAGIAATHKIAQSPVIERSNFDPGRMLRVTYLKNDRTFYDLILRQVRQA